MIETDRAASAGERASKAYWQARAETRLPPQSEVLARNAAISGTYARWYSARPLFKWAGMAAFSSHRVGLALRLYEFHTLADELVGATHALTGQPQAPDILADLSQIRETNNLVFSDIGWAHVAYMAPDGGIAAIEACLAGEPRSALMLEGFRAIEGGRQLLEHTPARRREAEELFWRGNTLLLKHEQQVIVQSQFDKLDIDCAIFLSLCTVMDFNAVYLSTDLRASSKFSWYLWTRGLWLLAAMRSTPQITNLRQRWYWIETGLIPLWRRVEQHDPHLREKMEILGRGAAQ